MILDYWKRSDGASVNNPKVAHTICNCVFVTQMAAPCRHLRNEAIAREYSLEGFAWENKWVNPSWPQPRPWSFDALLLVAVQTSPTVDNEYLNAENPPIASKSHQIAAPHAVLYRRRPAIQLTAAQKLGVASVVITNIKDQITNRAFQNVIQFSNKIKFIHQVFYNNSHSHEDVN